ncbi:BA14K family protein [Mesorhizobium sp. NBSH29]|uniref:BA14K family protein n=1 Tax=Mesorhizobium sp. NBSH29 TaxID=2654249 RepID=UPI0018968618|nr:BA14K family protein [Mesorhizobium sp. NBSH29]QPC88412.1 BA14K family protein [Mesorhizobium sp. NBSH29]
MNRFFKTAVLGAALAATTLTAIPAANAGDRYRRHHNGDAIAAGVLGLAAGAVIGSALSQPRYREPVYEDEYYEPRPVYRQRRVTRVYEEPVYVRRGAEPWSREWYRYCQNRYRSFDTRTGTYVGYDGNEHFCVAN